MRYPKSKAHLPCVDPQDNTIANLEQMRRIWLPFYWKKLSRLRFWR